MGDSCTCSRARMRLKIGRKGIYLRFERMNEICREVVENEIKMQKKREKICTIQKKAVILQRKMRGGSLIHTLWKRTAPYSCSAFPNRSTTFQPGIYYAKKIKHN